MHSFFYQVSCSDNEKKAHDEFESEIHHRRLHVPLPLHWWERSVACSNAKKAHMEVVDSVFDERESLVLLTTLQHADTAIEPNMFPCMNLKPLLLFAITLFSLLFLFIFWPFCVSEVSSFRLVLMNSSLLLILLLPLFFSCLGVAEEHESV